jgi:ankyrin repeat protein
MRPRGEENVRLLLDWGADVAREDQCERQPLYAAAQGGNTAVLALLVEGGAELDHRAKDAQGTALHVAVYWKNKEAVEFLLARGADPNSRTANWQETPLHSAARAADGGSRRCAGQLSAIVQILVHHAADIDAVNCAGITPLKWVVLFGRSKEVARALIENGASVEVVDDEGRTLIELARERNRLYMMELFADSTPSSVLSGRPEHPKGPVERDTEHQELRRSQADSTMELQG